MMLRLDRTGFGDLEIFQNPAAFCYGVDAVLLADFAADGAARRKAACRIMDLGTGTGIVPLILSHKTSAGYIAGMELQKEAWELAEKNRAHNGLQARLAFFHRDVKDFDGALRGTFDVVTTNPPYTEGNCGIASSNRAKAVARHETTASLDDFVRTAAALLRDKGDFYMVHRPARLVDICESCRKYRLEPKEMRFVSGKPMEKPNIILVHCVKNGNRELRLLDPLYVHREDGSYSEEILKIYEKK
ncbi:MAG: tRNA1(Val) (adenine(37)-N6)-methyltransferase [Emergencia sp.]|nr:tRNA1(Val) (adenine(37)-N6)-methyltransferase [Emergencia sp.]